RGHGLLEASSRIGEREGRPHGRRARCEHREAHAELLKSALDVLRAEPNAPVEAQEVPLEVLDRSRREVARGEDEAEAEVVERHASPPLRGLLELLRFARALLADPLDEPVAVR